MEFFIVKLIVLLLSWTVLKWRELLNGGVLKWHGRLY